MAKFDRKRPARFLNLGTLIVVEGETEEKYFKDFKESRRLARGRKSEASIRNNGNS